MLEIRIDVYMQCILLLYNYYKQQANKRTIKYIIVLFTYVSFDIQQLLYLCHWRIYFFKFNIIFHQINQIQRLYHQFQALNWFFQIQPKLFESLLLLLFCMFILVIRYIRHTTLYKIIVILWYDCPFAIIVH